MAGTHADPNNIGVVNQYVKPIPRPDRSTIAPSGNRVTAAGLRSIATLGRLDRQAANRAQPLGSPVEAA
jgi:hypothetical protein